MLVFYSNIAIETKCVAISVVHHCRNVYVLWLNHTVPSITDILYLLCEWAAFCLLNTMYLTVCVEVPLFTEHCSQCSADINRMSSLVDFYHGVFYLKFLLYAPWQSRKGEKKASEKSTTRAIVFQDLIKTAEKHLLRKKPLFVSLRNCKGRKR